MVIQIMKRSIWDSGKSCVLEEEYQAVFERNLTLNRLSEVILSPCCPDRGDHLSYDYHLAPSVYVENDIVRLIRLKELIKKDVR